MNPDLSNPLVDPCPTPNSDENTWTETTAVWNWNGGDWVLESNVTTSEPTFVSSDLPPAPTDWVPAEDFNDELAQDRTNRGGIRVEYNYDYLPEGSILPAKVVGWSASSGNNTRNCPDQMAIRQREVFRYISTFGPEDVPSNETITGNFATNNSNYVVTSDNSPTPLQPVNGWYSIPPGAQVTITKSVILPQMTPYNDTFPTPPQTAPYDNALRRDQSIVWSVNRDLTITAIHDAGQDNINSMPQREETLSNAGSMEYAITRP
jgi:hypothetical protein